MIKIALPIERGDEKRKIQELDGIIYAQLLEELDPSKVTKEKGMPLRHTNFINTKLSIILLNPAGEDFKRNIDLLTKLLTTLKVPEDSHKDFKENLLKKYPTFLCLTDKDIKTKVLKNDCDVLRLGNTVVSNWKEQFDTATEATDWFLEAVKELGGGNPKTIDKWFTDHEKKLKEYEISILKGFWCEMSMMPDATPGKDKILDLIKNMHEQHNVFSLDGSRTAAARNSESFLKEEIVRQPEGKEKPTNLSLPLGDPIDSRRKSSPRSHILKKKLTFDSILSKSSSPREKESFRSNSSSPREKESFPSDSSLPIDKDDTAERKRHLRRSVGRKLEVSREFISLREEESSEVGDISRSPSPRILTENKHLCNSDVGVPEVLIEFNFPQKEPKEKINLDSPLDSSSLFESKIPKITIESPTKSKEWSMGHNSVISPRGRQMGFERPEKIKGGDQKKIEKKKFLEIAKDKSNGKERRNSF